MEYEIGYRSNGVYNKQIIIANNEIDAIEMFSKSTMYEFIYFVKCLTPSKYSSFNK